MAHGHCTGHLRGDSLGEGLVGDGSPPSGDGPPWAASLTALGARRLLKAQDGLRGGVIILALKQRFFRGGQTNQFPRKNRRFRAEKQAGPHPAALGTDGLGVFYVSTI